MSKLGSRPVLLLKSNNGPELTTQVLTQNILLKKQRLKHLVIRNWPYLGSKNAQQGTIDAWGHIKAKLSTNKKRPMAKCSAKVIVIVDSLTTVL